MKTVLVCGGRDYNNKAKVYEILTSLGKIDCVIHGGATGADSLAGSWAIANGVHVAQVKALWDVHGRSAGPIRNAVMAAFNPTVCLAFPGGAGTRNMVSQCRAKGIDVIEVD